MGSPVGGQQYCLRWNNYQANMTSVFHQLLTDENFVDVTLSCQDQNSIKAHKVVLSACSPYFQKILLENPCKHPVIILPQEVSFTDLHYIIEFVYRGEVDVGHPDLNSLLRTAEQLKIKGLCEVAAREINNEPRRMYPKVKFSTFSNKRKYEVYDFQHSMGSEIEREEEEEEEDEDVYVEESMSPEPKNLAVHKKRHHEQEIIDVNANSSIQPKLQEPLGGAIAAVQQRVHDRLGVKMELRGEEHPLDMAIEPHQNERSASEDDQTMMITPELLGLIPTSSLHADVSCDHPSPHRTTKHWSQEDMELALDALRTQTMNLTKASAAFGIPSTTLWQRAHRLGINTPKKDSAAKTWSEADLNLALDELRAGRISANRASKTYHIPSSTLYKIARKEGIKLSAPFNASPTTWNSEDLNRALEAIRNGASVQKAAAEFGIPSGTLYGRCKREGIELNKNTPVPWSHTDMNEALETVRGGEMSINQAAIHFNLPYSSLYGRFKRVKYESLDPQAKLEFDMYSMSSDTH